MSKRFKKNSSEKVIQMPNYYIRKKDIRKWTEISKPSFYRLLHHEVKVYSHLEITKSLNLFPIEGIEHSFRISETPLEDTT